MTARSFASRRYFEQHLIEIRAPCTKKNAIRVLLVDDHPVVREGIKRLLETQDGILVAGEAGNGHQALELARRLSPDVVPLDMQMPGMSGDLVAQELLQARSSPALLS